MNHFKTKLKGHRGRVVVDTSTYIQLFYLEKDLNVLLYAFLTTCTISAYHH